MANERDIQQRSIGCIGFSAIVHLGALFAVSLMPALIRPQTSSDPVGAAQANGTDMVYMDLKGQPQPPAPPAPEPVKVQEIAKSEIAVPVETKLPEKKIVEAKLPKKLPEKKAAKKTALPQKVAPVIADVKGDTEVAAAVEEAKKEEKIEPVTAAPVPVEEKIQDVEAAAEEVAPPKEEASPAEVAAAKEEPVAQEKPQAVAEEAKPQPAPVMAAAPQTEQGNGGSSQTTTQAAAAIEMPTEGEIVDASNLRQRAGNPKPVYPSRDRLAGNQGTAVFLAYVEKDGTISKIILESGTKSRSLDEAAVTAFKKWRFEPGQESWIRQPFNFSLNGNAEMIPGRLRR